MTAAEWAVLAVSAWAGILVFGIAWIRVGTRKPAPKPQARPARTPAAPAPTTPDRARDNYRARPAENLGTCTMTVNFYDTGATVTYNHVHRTRDVDWPTVEDQDLRDWLTGGADHGV